MAKSQKSFRVELIVHTSRKVEESDIAVLDDDVIDGFTLTRGSRLGDIASAFYLDSISGLSVKEVTGTDSRLAVVILPYTPEYGKPGMPKIVNTFKEAFDAIRNFQPDAPQPNGTDSLESYLMRIDRYRAEGKIALAGEKGKATMQAWIIT